MFYLTITFFFIGLLKQVSKWWSLLKQVLTMTVPGTGCLSRKRALTSMHFTVSSLDVFLLQLPAVASLRHNQESSRREIGASFKGVYSGRTLFLEGQSVSKTNIPRSWFRGGQDTSINTPLCFSLNWTRPNKIKTSALPQKKRWCGILKEHQRLVRFPLGRYRCTAFLSPVNGKSRALCTASAFKDMEQVF